MSKRWYIFEDIVDDQGGYVDFTFIKSFTGTERDATKLCESLGDNFWAGTEEVAKENGVLERMDKGDMIKMLEERE